MQTELRPVEGYLENVLDFLQHSDIIRSCLIELNISEKNKDYIQVKKRKRKRKKLYLGHTQKEKSKARYHLKVLG